MTLSIEHAARLEAAHQAYFIVEKYGAEDGAAILRGRFVATMRAIAAVQGWGVVRDLVCQNGEHVFVPAHGRKLELVVSNTAEVVSA